MGQVKFVAVVCGGDEVLDGGWIKGGQPCASLLDFHRDVALSLIATFAKRLKVFFDRLSSFCPRSNMIDL